LIVGPSSFLLFASLLPSIRVSGDEERVGTGGRSVGARVLAERRSAVRLANSSKFIRRLRTLALFMSSACAAAMFSFLPPHAFSADAWSARP